MHASPERAHERQRRLALGTYVTAAALTSIAFIATFQNASVAAPQITGTASTGGLPSSAAVAGTAIAAAVLSSLMAARGRRAGIVTGLGISLAGSVVTYGAIVAWSFPLLLVGGVLIGFGNAAIALSRYAASDMYPSAHRGGAVGFVVWGSTLGAVAGPNLVAPANAIGLDLDLPRFAGGFAMAILFLLAALAVAVLGPRAPQEPAAPSTPGGEAASMPPRTRTPIRQLVADLLNSVRGRTAVLALVSGQIVMTLIMTMTPYHLDHTGHGGEVIGFVISAHTFGMFALSPLSGRLVERFGGVSVVMVGFGTLAVAGVLGAVVPDDGGTLLMVPLFLLGYGWNMTFVAGSSLLTSGEAYADRARLQGVVDACVWGAAASAGVVAGFLVALAGYAVLCLAGAGAAVLLAALMAADRRAVRVPAT
jgi:MFS family permease